ncbi:MAG: glycosyltransferase family 39 protein [Caldilineaceae bacterium]|nr:glycosyltransferase family 39 protein [Caldilineaceae bacterium]
MRLSYIATILLSFGLGCPLLTRFPFRQDEAIYSVWALHFWQDPFFLTIWPDKPPVYLSALALAYKAFGVREASARWLNISCTTITVALVIACARHLWGQRAALLAGLTLALNPFTISFAATAYTDPLLVLLGSAAIYAALNRRSYWSGVWLGLAVMTKQQGLFYVPLVLGMLMLSWARPHWPRRKNMLKELLYWAGGIATIVAPIIYWDSLRWATAPSPWDLSMRNYGGVSGAPIAQWLPRAQSWAALAWYLLASNYLWLFVTAMLIYPCVARVWLPAIARRQMQAALWPIKERFGKLHQASTTLYAERGSIAIISAAAPLMQRNYVLLLLVWLLGFMAIHLGTNIQTWDRYLLPLIPVAALLWGGYVAGELRSAAPKLASVIIVTWLLLLMPPAWQAAQGGLPIGGDHGDYAGLRPAMQWIKQEALAGSAPPSVVLYHNVLGWHLQYYLYAQIQHGQVDLRWFPHVFYLAQNATTAPHMRKFLITPSWAPARELAEFATMSRVQVIPRARFGKMRIVELAPLAADYCNWCYCNGWPREIFPPLSLSP